MAIVNSFLCVYQAGYLLTSHPNNPQQPTRTHRTANRATHLILPLIRTALRHTAAVTGAEGSGACEIHRKEVVTQVG